MNIVKYEVDSKTYDGVIEFSDGVKAECNLESGRWIKFTGPMGTMKEFGSNENCGIFQPHRVKLDMYDEQGPGPGDAQQIYI